MRSPRPIAGALMAGAIAGLPSGVLFGVATTDPRMLPTVAALVRADSAAVGWIVHLAIAAVIGAGFGLLVFRQRTGTGEMLFWGLAYGAFWWFLGPLTLLPLLLGQPVGWDVHTAQQQFPSLLGHLLYGATVGLGFAALTWGAYRRTAVRPQAAPAVWGATAGGLAAALLAAAFDAYRYVPSLGGGRSLTAWLGTGLLFGVGYATLYPRARDSAGAGLVRGTAYGFLWWAVVVLVAAPVLAGRELDWSVTAARTSFPALPAYLLLGAAAALLLGWLSALSRVLLGPAPSGGAREPPGVDGLRAVGRGAAAGIAGGLVFTLVMLQIGFLPVVASLVGAASPATGFAIHLLISVAIGGSYGLLFRRQTYNAASGLGWGLSYGLLWWLLGPLTLLPVLLGGEVQWTASVAAATFPSLVGHLAYGAALGILFQRLEARYSPWWINRSEAEAEHARMRREQALSSAPAVWALMITIALTIPIVLQS